jgi:hypothetical protein
MKKLLMLATMAVATAAVAAPSMASASEFKHEGNAITATKETKLTGTIGFSSPGVGTFECEMHPTISFHAGGASATIISLGLTTDRCRGTGAFAHCQLAEHAVTAGSSVTPGPADLNLNNFRLFKRYVTGDPGVNEGTSTTPCPLAGLPAGLEFEAEEITLTPDNSSAISEISEISGEGAINAIGVGVIAEIEVYGELTVEAGTEETIGIG